MKRKLLFLVIIVLIIFAFNRTVYADDLVGNFDEGINGVLNGINEEDFNEINKILSGLFNDELSFKDRVILFITGEYSFSLDGLKNYFLSRFKQTANDITEVMIYVLFIGVLCGILNVIISKNADKNEKSIIYYISYILIISLMLSTVYRLFEFANNKIITISKTIETTFPIILTLAEFSGGFGNGLIKPFLAFSSLFSSAIIKSVFMPILLGSAACIVVGNISETVKLDSLSKTLQSLVKWLLGIITLVFGVFISAQGIVNVQYSGISFKILKYATGSIIPIVGGFLSGGVDVLLSSAVLVKNSLGLIMVIYLIISSLSSGVTILISSFIMRFSVSIAEPVLDKKVVNLVSNLANLLNLLAAIVFVAGFIFVLVCFALISSTGLIF